MEGDLQVSIKTNCVNMVDACAPIVEKEILFMKRAGSENIKIQMDDHMFSVSKDKLLAILQMIQKA